MALVWKDEKGTLSDYLDDEERICPIHEEPIYYTYRQIGKRNLKYLCLKCGAEL